MGRPQYDCIPMVTGNEPGMLGCCPCWRVLPTGRPGLAICRAGPRYYLPRPTCRCLGGDPRDRASGAPCRTRCTYCDSLHASLFHVGRLVQWAVPGVLSVGPKAMVPPLALLAPVVRVVTGGIGQESGHAAHGHVGRQPAPPRSSFMTPPRKHRCMGGFSPPHGRGGCPCVPKRHPRVATHGTRQAPPL